MTQELFEADLEEGQASLTHAQAALAEMERFVQSGPRVAASAKAAATPIINGWQARVRALPELETEKRQLIIERANLTYWVSGLSGQIRVRVRRFQIELLRLWLRVRRGPFRRPPSA